MAGRYALIVATDEYRDSKLNRLRTPAMDAAALAEVLGDPEIGDFEVQLATNEPDHLLRRRIAAFFGDRRRDDLLLLHFSCHGLKDDSGQLYFATTDTEVAYLDASAIPAEFVSRQMAISRSNSVLMLLDCCYSGAIARGLRFRAGDQVDVEDHLGGHGRAIITASSAMEYAFEGDELTGEGRPSVFTAAVVKALETGEADRDQDRWISVRELYDYVCDEVREVTPHQRPNLLSHLEGELYVARSRYVAPVSLPTEVLDALANPLASVRVGAVAALEEILRGPDHGLAGAAREQLTAVAANDDSRRVTSAARDALAAAGDTPPTTLSRVEAVAPRVEPDPTPAAEPAPPDEAVPAGLHEDAGAPAPPDEAVPAGLHEAAGAPAPPIVTSDDAPAETVAPDDEPAAARRRRRRRRELPPPIEIPPPVAAADPAAAAPARRPAPRRGLWLALLGGAVALLLAAIVLHWAWHDTLDYVGTDEEGDSDLDRLQLATPLLTGIGALGLAIYALARRRAPARLAWLVLDVLAGATMGLVFGIASREDELAAGTAVALLGALAVAFVADRACPSPGTRSRALRRGADVAIAAGGLAAAFALLRWGLDFNRKFGLVAVAAALCGPALLLLRRARAVRRPELVVVTAGSLIAGYVLYVDGPSGLRIALVGATTMVIAGLLAGEPRKDDGVGAAGAEGEEGAQDALALEARRRQHA